MPDTTIAPAPGKPLSLNEINSVMRSNQNQNFTHFAVAKNEKGQDRLVASDSQRPGNYIPKPVEKMISKAYKESVGQEPNAEAKALIESGVNGRTPSGQPLSPHQFELELRKQANRQLAQKLMPDASPEALNQAADALTNQNITPDADNLPFLAALAEAPAEQAADLVISELRAPEQKIDAVNNKAKAAAGLLVQRGDIPEVGFQKIGGQLVADQAAKVSQINPNAFMRDLNPASAFSGVYLSSGPAADLIDTSIRHGFAAGNDAKSRAAAIVSHAAGQMQNYPAVQDYLGSVSQSAKQQLEAKGLDHETVNKLSQLAQTDAFALRAMNPVIVHHNAGPGMSAISAQAQLTANFSKTIPNDPGGLMANARTNLTDAYSANAQRGAAYAAPQGPGVTMASQNPVPAPAVEKSRVASVRDALRGAASRISDAASSLKTTIGDKLEHKGSEKRLRDVPDEIQKAYKDLQKQLSDLQQKPAADGSNAIDAAVGDPKAYKNFMKGSTDIAAKEKEIKAAMAEMKDGNPALAQLDRSKVGQVLHSGVRDAAKSVGSKLKA